jgi:hypothetical protein
MGRAGRTYVRDHFDRKEQAQAMLALMLDLAGKGGTDA